MVFNIRIERFQYITERSFDTRDYSFRLNSIFAATNSLFGIINLRDNLKSAKCHLVLILIGIYVKLFIFDEKAISLNNIGLQSLFSK